MVGGLGFQRGAILRVSAVAAASSMTISQSQAVNKRRHLLEEAKSTVRIDTLLGMDCQRKEEKIVSKIVELEDNDLSRIAGLRRPEKMGKIKNLVKQRSVDVLLLQETKRRSMDEYVVRPIWPYEGMEFMLVDLDGSASGLLLNIYAPNEVLKRRQLWDTLANVYSHFPNPWCVEGGFNEIRYMDHCPILLKDDDRDWGPKPFKFINAWLSHPSFMSEVKKRWEEVQVQGWAGLRVMRKLNMLRSHLRVWNKEMFGNIDTLLKSAEEELHKWDLKAESRPLDEQELRSRRETRSQVWQLSKSKERLWHQKSRQLWAYTGDKNTRYFHIMASRRQRKNMLDSVLVEGVSLEDPTQEIWKLCFLKLRYGKHFRIVMGIKPQAQMVLTLLEVLAYIERGDNSIVA
ncbi:uncharacterized protein LOC114277542 [Camellia sinensis]|uniref:uncharacterized protein LOC114277542 n=1 Tax=Camellia sinensis TaxID=4442 RepID=UPI001036510E|nr:uncharacterized protein LOC114277542 [Camellia sinensis]